MILKKLICGFRGHDFVGVRCVRCARAWAWKPEPTAAEVQKLVDRALENSL